MLRGHDSSVEDPGGLSGRHRNPPEPHGASQAVRVAWTRGDGDRSRTLVSTELLLALRRVKPKRRFFITLEKKTPAAVKLLASRVLQQFFILL